MNYDDYRNKPDPFGNAELNAEQLQTYELAYGFHSESSAIYVTIFQTRLAEKIDKIALIPDKPSNPCNAPTYDNSRQHIKSSGLELDFKTLLNDSDKTLTAPKHFASAVVSYPKNNWNIAA